MKLNLFDWRRSLSRRLDNAASSNSKVRAHIDGLDKRSIFGWIKHRNDDEPLSIDVYIDDVRVAQAHLADQYRPDLAEAGFGDGCYAFNIIFPPSMRFAADTVTAHVRLTGSNSDIVSRTFDLTKPVWDSSIDGLGGTQLFGWVKRRDIETPQAIDIYVGGHRIAEGHIASQFRQDLFDAGIGNGCYGFTFPVPDTFLTIGQPVFITIRAANTNDEVASKNFGNREKPSYVLKVEKASAEQIAGWCVNESSIGEVINLDVYLDGVYYTTINSNRSRGDLRTKGISLGLGGFSLNNPMMHMERGAHDFHFKFPDGTISEKITIESDQTHRRFPAIDPSTIRNSVTIIVPIYNAPDDLEICIDRLLACTPDFAKILLIDDCSPDPAITAILRRHASNTRIKILANERNIGFTSTVNRGLRESGTDDVVLLNSDARVTPGWLQGLIVAAYSASKIATVTAMSDRAGAFSAPSIGNDNPLPDTIDEMSFARAFRRRSLGLYPRVPTGNGFCMYVRRAAIAEIGFLDAEAFPRGYGEENDFCMRAIRAGWLNIVDDRTYIFHERSASFGAAKVELLTAGRAIIDERYPEYNNAIDTFTTDEKFALARFAAGRATQDCLDDVNQSPRVLFVISTTTGGTPQTNRDLIDGLGDAISCWILRCDSKMLELSAVIGGDITILRTHRLLDPVDPISHSSPEYDEVVASLLFDFDIDVVHIRHIAWHSLSLPRIAKDLGIKVVVSFHDYYTLTSSIKLIDDTGEFLGSTYLPEGSIYRESLWPRNVLPIPSGTWLSYWRERFEQAFGGCDAFVTTSPSPRALILEKTPKLPADKFFVIPHGRDFTEFLRIRNALRRGEPVRILVPGNINAAKGLNIIFALAEHDTARQIEFHILGNIQNTGRRLPPNIITHGNYQRSEFGSKASATRPHVGAVFSIWNETYCHTLTELWSIGLPAIVFDFPTVANRVRKTGAGWAMDHHDIPKLYNEILRVSSDEMETARTDAALAAWQSGEGLGQTVNVMAASYYDIYRTLLRGDTCDINQPRATRIAVVDLSTMPAHGQHASIRFGSYAKNAIEKDTIFVRMSAESLLANVRAGTVDGAIIRLAAIPQAVLNDLADALTAENVRYLLDVEEQSAGMPGQDGFDGAASSPDSGRNRLLKRASVLSVDTPRLAEAVKGLNENVKLFPDGLPDDLQVFG